MTVKIKIICSKKEIGKKILSLSNIEFYFVKNVLNHMIANACRKNPSIEAYYEYLKCVAVSKELSQSESIVGILKNWLDEFFIPNINNDVTILLEADNDVFYACV